MRILSLGLASSLLMFAAGSPSSFDKHDIEGIWEAHSTAEFGLEAHSAEENIRAGDTVIVDPADGKIPYTAAARKQRDENFKNREKADPLNRCYLPGVPRITYLSFPFQIFQTPEFVVMTYEYVHASRTVHMKNTKHLDDIAFWMGDSRGRWYGDTLVVDVADLEPAPWLDAAGDFHSDQFHVIERYTRTGPDTMTYEATMEDPKVYTRPWTIRIPLFKHTEKNAELYEYECHVYKEHGAGFQKDAR